MIGYSSALLHYSPCGQTRRLIQLLDLLNSKYDTLQEPQSMTCSCAVYHLT